MEPTFHLSIAVRSLEDSILFFTKALKGKVSHRDPSGYVNIDLFGSQITLKEHPTIQPSLPDFHFGFNLCLDDFDSLAKNIQMNSPQNIAMEPMVVDAGTPLERKKMYLKCPTGYLVELKAYKKTH